MASLEPCCVGSCRAKRHPAEDCHHCQLKLCVASASLMLTAPMALPTFRVSFTAKPRFSGEVLGVRVDLVLEIMILIIFTLLTSISYAA